MPKTVLQFITSAKKILPRISVLKDSDFLSPTQFECLERILLKRIAMSFKAILDDKASILDNKGTSINARGAVMDAIDATDQAILTPKIIKDVALLRDKKFDKDKLHLCSDDEKLALKTLGIGTGNIGRITKKALGPGNEQKLDEQSKFLKSIIAKTTLLDRIKISGLVSKLALDLIEIISLQFTLSSHPQDEMQLLEWEEAVSNMNKYYNGNQDIFLIFANMVVNHDFESLAALSKEIDSLLQKHQPETLEQVVHECHKRTYAISRAHINNTSGLLPPVELAVVLAQYHDYNLVIQNIESVKIDMQLDLSDSIEYLASKPSTRYRTIIERRQKRAENLEQLQASAKYAVSFDELRNILHKLQQQNYKTGSTKPQSKNIANLIETFMAKIDALIESTQKAQMVRIEEKGNRNSTKTAKR